MSREFRKQTISPFSILISILLFVIFLIIPGKFLGFEPDAQKTIALGIFMISLWITEAIPIPVTSMLPAVMLPLFGIMDFKDALVPYINPVIILFFGGFVLAISLEKYNIHNRIAFYLIDKLGSSPSRVIAGFMIATAFLSLWISNTSTAVIMFPIAMSVIHLMEKHSGESKTLNQFALALMLSVAYAANVGGSGTLVGTPVNALMVGMLDEFANFQLNFGSWLILGLPFVIVMTFLAWLVLTRIFFRVGNKKIEGIHEYIVSEQKKLGPVSRTEKRIFVIFLLTASLWIFRGFLVKTFQIEFLTDALIALIAAILLFSIPGGEKKRVPILVWADSSKIPWGILILFGGGLSLANGLYETGVIGMIGEKIIGASHLSLLLITTVTVFVMLFLTEVIGGTPLSSVLFPVIIGVAAALDLEATVLIIPMALAGNAAFMLPMGTPPNAIVFASGYLKVKDMVRVGWLMNIITILVIISLGRYLMQFV